MLSFLVCLRVCVCVYVCVALSFACTTSCAYRLRTETESTCSAIRWYSENAFLIRKPATTDDYFYDQSQTYGINDDNAFVTVPYDEEYYLALRLRLNECLGFNSMQPFRDWHWLNEVSQWVNLSHSTIQDKCFLFKKQEVEGHKGVWKLNVSASSKYGSGYCLMAPSEANGDEDFCPTLDKQECDWLRLPPIEEEKAPCDR
eukprot:TRINITY_DN40756_c0_g1_i1.p1 TRINITY_DN40756_c0_g1~~TRINITY_DN40756_c0_g1_i1.p1  ORF type:complete len:201 (-),score=11.01 TRINITY_DN40756_c0_g1_i1:455-1057(-)